MYKILIAVAFALMAFPAQALDSTVTVTPVFKTTRTIADQPVQLPQKNVEIIVSMYDIPPGAVLPVHQHHYQRYAYVLSGTLSVNNLEVLERTVRLSKASSWSNRCLNGTREQTMGLSRLNCLS